MQQNEKKCGTCQMEHGNHHCMKENLICVFTTIIYVNPYIPQCMTFNTFNQYYQWRIWAFFWVSLNMISLNIVIGPISGLIYFMLCYVILLKINTKVEWYSWIHSRPIFEVFLRMFYEYHLKTLSFQAKWVKQHKNIKSHFDTSILVGSLFSKHET